MVIPANSMGRIKTLHFMNSEFLDKKSRDVGKTHNDLDINLMRFRHAITILMMYFFFLSEAFEAENAN